jgi:hypothetical protein
MEWTMDESGFDFREEKMFLFSTAYKPALGPTPTSYPKGTRGPFPIVI